MNGFQPRVDNDNDRTKKSLPEKLSLGYSSPPASSTQYQNSGTADADQDQSNSQDCEYSSVTNCPKSSRIKECIQQSISAESKKKIASILNEVHQLSDLEKLLLYLQLPTGAPANIDPLKQKSPGNPLGKKADITVAQTYTWIQSHLEEDPEVSLPKQEIYEEYKLFCDANKIEGLCAADFGKVMKYVFPSVKPRRLGTRGNSRYCYSGLRKKISVEPPLLPDLDTKVELENLQDIKNASISDEISSAASCLIFEWVEKLLNKKFDTLPDLASHLVENLYVDTRSVAAFTILSSATNQTTGKASQGGNLLLKSTSTNRRRETQLHLQRKLQEKELIREQKKKIQEQKNVLTKNFKSNGCKKSVKKEQSNGRSKGGSSPSNVVKTEVPEKSNGGGGGLLAEQFIKKEEKSISNPLKPIRCYSEGSIALEQEFAGRPKKVAITRKTSSPGACFSQGVPSIIILPSLQQVDIDVKKCQSVQKPSSQKYKRIQPKPSQLQPNSSASLGGVSSQSFLNTENGNEKPVCGYSLELAEANGLAALQDIGSTKSQCTSSKTSEPPVNDKPNVDILKSISAALAGSSSQHNLRVVQSEQIGAQKKALTRNSTQTARVASPMAKKGKRSASLGKESKFNKTSNTKRGLEDSSKSNRPFKKPLMDSVSSDSNEFPTILDSGTENLNNLSEELQQSTSASDEMTVQVNSLERSSIDEVSIQQIETDALMEEYLHSNNDSSSLKDYSNSGVKTELEGTKCIQPTNKLSQLRLLLQRNLPQPSSSRASISKPIAAVSEENSVLESFSLSGLNELRQAMINNSNRQSSFRSQSEPSNFLFNWNGIEIIDPSLDLGDSVLKSEPNSEGGETLENCGDVKLFGSTSLEGRESEFTNCANSALTEDRDMSLATSSMKLETGLDFGLSRNNFEVINPDLASLDKSNILSRNSSYTQVPPSPNTRRRAFNFMPISPRQTPIPENLGFANAGGNNLVSSASPLQMYIPTSNGVNNISVAVGPSQPPSTASSPFVSPRGTPVPISRSRHNSGQSAYSTPRQTPLQNFIDSGVSSISTSPFVSPQTTPVPVSRLRHNSNHGGTGKTVTFSAAVSQGSIQNGLSFQPRSRHNSGPLPPPPSLATTVCTTSGGVVSYFTSPRSAPLSPLVGENFTQTNFNFPNNTMEVIGHVRSRHSSASSVNIPASPLSSPVSPNGTVAPSSHLIGNSDPLVGASDTSSLTNNIAKKFGLIQNEEGRNTASTLWNVNNRLPSVSSIKTGNQFSWPSFSDGQFCQPTTSALHKRNRHVSGSVIHHRPSANNDPLVQEIQSLLQSSSPSSPNANTDSISRSRSVPLQQMILLEHLGGSSSSTRNVSLGDSSGNFNFNNGNNAASEDLFTTSRSYPSTVPLDNGVVDAFGEENLASSPYSGTCGNFSEENSQKEQDLGTSRVSGLASWANPLETLSSRRNITELLENDYLQTTLEDLRDCDNDFSKFAQELEQMDQKEPEY